MSEKVLVESSLGKRFLTKLASNGVKIVCSFATLGLIPRALGVEAYGDFGFLTIFFNRVFKLLKMGTSTAYFVKISKDATNKVIVGFYFYYMMILSVLIFSSVYLTVNSDFKQLIFLGQKSLFIFAACSVGFLQFFLEFLNNTNDAYGYTIQNEVRTICVAVLNAVVLALMFLTDNITLGNIFILNALIIIISIVLGHSVLRINRVNVYERLNLKKQEIYDSVVEFYTYSNPLVINGIVTFVAIMLDRWLLQRFHGSTEQGYYTLALQISAAIMLFSNSMSSLLLREMSQKAKGNKLNNELKEIFVKYNSFFFFIAAFFSVFISLNSEFIARAIGGDGFEGATYAVAALALYPIHHAYSMSVANLLLATQGPKVLRNVVLLTLLPGMLLSFFIMMPEDRGGLNYGALGVAVKTIFVQFVAVTIYLWLVSKSISISFSKYMLNQILIVVVIFFIAKLSQELSMVLLNVSIFIKFILSIVLYLFLTLTTVRYFPNLIGISKTDLNNFFIELKIKCNKIILITKGPEL